MTDIKAEVRQTQGQNFSLGLDLDTLLLVLAFRSTLWAHLALTSTLWLSLCQGQKAGFEAIGHGLATRPKFQSQPQPGNSGSSLGFELLALTSWLKFWPCMVLRPQFGLENFGLSLAMRTKFRPRPGNNGFSLGLELLALISELKFQHHRVTGTHGVVF